MLRLVQILGFAREGRFDLLQITPALSVLLLLKRRMEQRIRSNCYSLSYSVTHHARLYCQCGKFPRILARSPHPKTLHEAETDGWSNEFREACSCAPASGAQIIETAEDSAA